MGEPSNRAGFRWKLADDDDAPDGGSGQGTLFATEELAERHVGTGEYRGLEFFHVNARRIINEVPASSRMPFRHTINAYRGCSHACVYCLGGETPIRMAAGGDKPLRDVVKGDRVCGTVTNGVARRLVATDVVDQWSMVKPAFALVLDDGTRITASGDHRFLTDRGWRHVALPGPASLHHGSALLAIDSLGSARELRLVVDVRPLGVELPMYDLTTGTGDFVAAGVVSHNCFARPTHEYLGFGTGEDFDRKIVVKVNAVERTRAEVASRRWRGEHIAMGTNTDPYQRAEGKYHLTQGIIRALSEAANPFSILTKSTLILRDFDLLVDAASRTDVGLNFSIGTLDPGVWRATEPGTPPPDKRMDAVARFNAAGVPCGVLVAPVIPGMSDSDEQLRAVARAAVQAGARQISVIGLHLRRGVKEHFAGWLQRETPDLGEQLGGRFGSRAYLPKPYLDDLALRFRRFVAEARRH